MLEPSMRSRPGCSRKTGRSRQLTCMPRMKKQSAHAGLAVGVSLEPSLAHEIRTIAVCFFIFSVDVAHHGPNRQ